MKKIMTREEIIATTKQVVAEKKEAKKAEKVVKEEKKAVEENPAKDEKKAKKVKEEKSTKVEEKAEKKVKKPSAKKAEKKVVIKSFKAFKALTDKNKVRIILEWSETDKVHFEANFGKPLPKGKGSYFEETTPILVESNNVLLWSPRLKVTHLMLNEDFKSQSLNGIPFTIEVVEG